MTQHRTPAQLYALVVGAVLVGAGILGFFYNSSFATGDDVPRDAVLGLLDVNAWHNVVHLSTGALGLATFASPAAARGYALGLGAVYLVVTIWGFAIGDGEVLLDLIPINTEDNILHLLLAVAGLAAGAAGSTRAEVQPGSA
ncbi:MAG: DUF4383 domain-containing protein [Actinomycetota bacterium]|nr:DUF4383 domain-containing protein [Actinomycetota bacterium]